MRAIAGQQLSVLAARAIYGRLTARFGGRPPTPQEILADDPEELRAAAGLSRAKVSYLRSLAEHVISGELELERLDELADEQVIAELVAVKGIGLWTAHMFLMFQLERPDVLPVGDLGIRRAIERAYGLDELPGPARRWSRSPSRGARTARSPAATCGARCTTSRGKRPRLDRHSERHLAPAAAASGWGDLQTAETCSSSATRNEEPQPQAATTFGLLTLKPAPCRLSS